MEKSHEELLFATQEEIDFFKKCVQGLPTMEGLNGDFKDKYGVPIPYGSSPHVARYLKMAIDIAKPKRILEIGTNCGVGAALILNLCDAELHSIDISDREETLVAANLLKLRFGDRFMFYLKKHFPLISDYYDLVFIDGGHDEKSVVEDIELEKYLKIPYLLFDDTYTRYGEVMKAISQYPNLRLIKDMDNLKLYRNE